MDVVVCSVWTQEQPERMGISFIHQAQVCLKDSLDQVLSVWLLRRRRAKILEDILCYKALHTYIQYFKKYREIDVINIFIPQRRKLGLIGVMWLVQEHTINKWLRLKTRFLHS